MAKISTTSVERSEILCQTLEDLMLALRSVNETPEDTEIELSIMIEVPGLGTRKLRLLDEVAIKVAWEVEGE